MMHSIGELEQCFLFVLKFSVQEKQDWLSYLKRWPQIINRTMKKARKRKLLCQTEDDFKIKSNLARLLSISFRADAKLKNRSLSYRFRRISTLFDFSRLTSQARLFRSLFWGFSRKTNRFKHWGFYGGNKSNPRLFIFRMIGNIGTRKEMRLTIGYL